MCIHESEDILHVLLCWIIGMKTCQIYSVWNMVKRRKFLEGEHMAKHARMTHDSPRFYRLHGIKQRLAADQFKCLCHSAYSAGDLTIIENTFIRAGVFDQGQIPISMACGCYTAAKCLGNLNRSIA